VIARVQFGPVGLGAGGPLPRFMEEGCSTRCRGTDPPGPVPRGTGRIDFVVSAAERTVANPRTALTETSHADGPKPVDPQYGRFRSANIGKCLMFRVSNDDLLSMTVAAMARSALSIV